MTLIEKFQAAGTNGREFRPVPFWAWNDKLEPAEIRWQIRQMKQAGFGGHFMHSRRGLAIPYMAKDWMECVLAACDETRTAGVLPWLYDEDCWPSGSAGRRVITGRPEMQSKFLVHEIIRPMSFRPEPNTVAVFVGRKNKAGTLKDFERIVDLQAARSLRLEASQVMVHFHWQAEELVDVMNRGATEMFIEATHEEYRRLIGRFFGGAIPGIFTDEPQFNNRPNVAAWSLQLPEFFRRANGYDLADRLPELFFPLPGSDKVRFDYHQTTMRLFLLAFTLPIYQWCERNRLALTGHCMAEDTLLGQIMFSGAVMPHYEYMQIPGIDQLGRGIHSPVLPKQCSSVANQFGRKRVLSEMWGCSGHNVSFEELRWITDWQAVNGINLVCPHLTLYSMRGCRKKDYPPTLSYHQPYWPQMRLLSDTIARTMALTSEGELVADTLVLHPVTSAWVLGTRRAEELGDLQHHLDRLTSALSGMHADFEFGDETIMERRAKVLKGAIAIGQRKYTTVVVPACVNWKASTLALMEKFRKAGGSLVFTGRLPHLLDGEPSEALETFVKKQTAVDIRRAAGLTKLKKLLSPKLTITRGRGATDATDVAAMWRKCGNEDLLFLTNQDPTTPQDLTIRMPLTGSVEQLDPATGEVIPLAARQTKTGSTFKLDLLPMGSTFVVVNRRRKPVTPAKPHPRPRRKKVLARKWQYNRLDPNVMLLDTARATFGDQGQTKPMHMADINQMLIVDGRDTVVELAFSFQVKRDLKRTRRLQLAVESAEDFEIHLNNLRVPLRNEGWWVDKSMHLLDVSRLVSPGKNVLTLRRPWHILPETRRRLIGLVPNAKNNWVYPEVELEPVYLVGDFGVGFDGAYETGTAGRPPEQLAPWDRQPLNRSLWVSGNMHMQSEPTSGSGQNLVRDGLAFFAGAVELSQTLVLDGNPSEHAVLEMDRPDAILAQVIVNGHELPPLWQAPWRVVVGPHLQKGKNELTVRLTSSLRNAMGPHHEAGGDSYWAGPPAFDGALRVHRSHLVERDAWRADYNLVPFGLGGDLVLYY